jgi:ceramide glucosyltransferase
MVSMIAVACGVAYVGLLALKILGACIALRQEKRRAHAALSKQWIEDVAIVQPILGGDPLLEKVLADNLIALPKAHFFWLLDENDAIGRAVTDALVAEYPLHHIHCSLYGEAPDGVNPKTFKLAAVLSSIEKGIFVVLDDDTRLSLSALAQLVSELDQADLVTALPCYLDDGSFGAQLMAQFVNNNAALTYLPLLPFLSPVTINGMCYVLRTDRLRALGGFAPQLHKLTDDLAMARSLRAQSAQLLQSSACVQIQTHTPSVTRYFEQMHRWFLFATLLLRSERPGMQALIGILHGIPPLLLWGLLACALTQPDGVVGGLVAMVVLMRSASLSALQWFLTGRFRHRPAVSLLAELLQPVHLVHALLVRRIRWRTRLYEVVTNEDFHAI